MTSHLKDATLDQYQAAIRKMKDLTRSKPTATSCRCVMQWIDADGVVVAQATYTSNYGKVVQSYQVAK